MTASRRPAGAEGRAKSSTGGSGGGGGAKSSTGGNGGVAARRHRPAGAAEEAAEVVDGGREAGGAKSSTGGSGGAGGAKSSTGGSGGAGGVPVVGSPGGEPANRRRLRHPGRERHLHGAALGHHGRPGHQPDGRHIRHRLLVDRGRHQRLLHLDAGDRKGLRRRRRRPDAGQPDHGDRRHGARVHRRRRTRARRHRARRREHRRDDLAPGVYKWGTGS